MNDLFIGQRTHVSARYRIAVAGREERHSSSGVLVSTGLGSTGWLRSVYAGWAAAAGAATERTKKARMMVSSSKSTGVDNVTFPWDADYLRFVVREPYPGPTTGTNVVVGIIGAGKQMTIMSEMPENGVIFSDGIESDYLEFNSGALARIGVAEKQGLLTV